MSKTRALLICDIFRCQEVMFAFHFRRVSSCTVQIESETCSALGLLNITQLAYWARRSCPGCRLHASILELWDTLFLFFLGHFKISTCVPESSPSQQWVDSSCDTNKKPMLCCEMHDCLLNTWRCSYPHIWPVTIGAIARNCEEVKSLVLEPVFDREHLYKLPTAPIYHASDRRRLDSDLQSHFCPNILIWEHLEKAK